VQVEIGPLPAAEGDPALLRQVWANLLSNAVKYSQTRGAGARVLVTGEHRGDLLHYSVLDNGVGFDMRYADKLFGVFQRLHSQEEFEGTGVGLAIVQRIVQRHGGRVTAAAEPGLGACFGFDLPVSEEVQ
jgi:light-regulated signal transduction histidine kinase (bacteriophytochrome)